MPERDAEGRAQQLTEAAVLRFGRLRAIRHCDHGRQHRRQQDDADRGDRGGPAEVREEEPGADGPARDADKICDAVIAGRLSTLRAWHHVRQ